MTNEDRSTVGECVKQLISVSLVTQASNWHLSTFSLVHKILPVVCAMHQAPLTKNVTLKMSTENDFHSVPSHSVVDCGTKTLSLFKWHGKLREFREVTLPVVKSQLVLAAATFAWLHFWLVGLLLFVKNRDGSDFSKNFTELSWMLHATTQARLYKLPNRPFPLASWYSVYKRANQTNPCGQSGAQTAFIPIFHFVPRQFSVKQDSQGPAIWRGLRLWRGHEMLPWCSRRSSLPLPSDIYDHRSLRRITCRWIMDIFSLSKAPPPPSPFVIVQKFIHFRGWGFL